MTYANPWLLILLVPLMLAFIIRFFTKPPSLVLSNIEHFTGQKGDRKRILFSMRQIPLLLETVGIALLIICLARPQKGVEVTEEHKEGVDIIFALDLSNSMNAFDPEGEVSVAEVRRMVEKKELLNRLDEAKKQLKRFIERRPDDRIGYVIFGNEAYVSCPPTLDHDYLQNQIKTTQFKMFQKSERGTNIAGALAASLSTLLDTDSKKKLIILITDGRNSFNDDITPEQAAEIASNEKIVIHTVGIGSRNPFFNDQRRGLYKVRDGRMDIDVPQMKRIAKKSGGQFFYAKDRKSFQIVMDQIDKLETSNFEQLSYTYFKELFQPWLMSAMALLFLSFFLQNSFLQRIP